MDESNIVASIFLKKYLVNILLKIKHKKEKEELWRKNREGENAKK